MLSEFFRKLLCRLKIHSCVDRELRSDVTRYMHYTGHRKFIVTNYKLCVICGKRKSCLTKIIEENSND